MYFSDSRKIVGSKFKNHTVIFHCIVLLMEANPQSCNSWYCQHPKLQCYNHRNFTGWIVQQYSTASPTPHPSPIVACNQRELVSLKPGDMASLGNTHDSIFTSTVKSLDYRRIQSFLPCPKQNELHLGKQKRKRSKYKPNMVNFCKSRIYKSKVFFFSKCRKK